MHIATESIHTESTQPGNRPESSTLVSLARLFIIELGQRLVFPDQTFQ
jgi:hypothetical protein